MATVPFFVGTSRNQGQEHAEPEEVEAAAWPRKSESLRFQAFHSVKTTCAEVKIHVRWDVDVAQWLIWNAVRLSNVLEQSSHVLPCSA